MPAVYAKVLEVVDGDTLKIEAMKRVDIMGDTKEVTTEATLRLRDIDTHETSNKQGEKEKQFVKDLLMKQQKDSRYHHPFEVYSEGDDWDEGGYGRTLGHLRNTDNKSLEVILVDNFDNILYEPKYGDDGVEEDQDS